MTRIGSFTMLLPVSVLLIASAAAINGPSVSAAPFTINLGKATPVLTDTSSGKSKDPTTSTTTPNDAPSSSTPATPTTPPTNTTPPSVAPSQPVSTESPQQATSPTATATTPPVQPAPMPMTEPVAAPKANNQTTEGQTGGSVVATFPDMLPIAGSYNDTSRASVKTANAQSTTDSTSVNYGSHQLSPQTADTLYRVAGIVAIVGVILYAVVSYPRWRNHLRVKGSPMKFSH